MRPYLENTHHKKKAGGVAQGIGPEFKPQCCKKKNKLRKSLRPSEAIEIKSVVAVAANTRTFPSALLMA
jgi:hypothetical protein